MMRQVILALLPAVAVYIVLFGFGVLIQLLLVVAAALLFEAVALHLRGLESRRFLEDGSVVVLAFLLCLAVPPYAPWWVGITGVGFAVLIGKHAFGGLGHNVFNPAMVGYVFVLLCFPLTLSTWPQIDKLVDYPGPLTSLRFIFGSQAAALDAISGATVLDHIKTQAALMHMSSEMRSIEKFGLFAGRGWEWINAAYVIGGLWLLWRRVITWRLPVSFLFSLAVAAMVGYTVDPELHRAAVFHVFAGGALLAAFFIVTDPVSSATTPRGMLVFGAGVGTLTYIIREFCAYPDGIAFAVVIMNSLAPLIDRFTQPRLYGKSKSTNDDGSPVSR
jgi:electron transport complex protein RnfD